MDENDRTFLDLFEYERRDSYDRYRDIYVGVTLLKDLPEGIGQKGDQVDEAVVDFRTGMVVFENIYRVLGKVSFRAEWIENNNKGRS